jgi:hypothetical protein
LRKRADWLAAGGYLLLTLALTYPLVRQFTAAIPGDGFDGWQNYWNLWWMKVALLEQGSSLYYTPLLYAPTGVSLLFHTLNPFNGFFTLPVQVAWGLFPAYNLAVVFSFTAGGFGTYLLARQVLAAARAGRTGKPEPRGTHLAAFTAGVIFAFAPFHMAHLLGHLQLISLEWLPYYALYAIRLVLHSPLDGRRWLRDAFMAGFFLLLVGLCDWYYVLYSLIFTVLVLVWAAWKCLRARAWPNMARLLAGLALTGLVFGLAIGSVLAPMLRQARQSKFMVPDPAQSRTLSADLLAFVTPQEFQPLWGAWARDRARNFTATVAEHQVFAGYSVLLLALAGIWTGRRSLNRKRPGRMEPGAGLLWLWLAVALVFWILALGPVLHINGQTALLPGGHELTLPYAWLARAIPFLNISRSVSRFDVMLMLALALLAAFGIQWLSARRKAGSVLALTVLGLILFEFWPAPYPLSPPDTPGWYLTLAADPRPGSVLNLPMNWDRPGYLLYQTVHHKPLAAAYISRDDPRTLVERAPVLQHFRHLGPDIIDLDLAQQGRQVLADLGVSWVVLDRYKMPGARERSYNEDTARAIFGGQAPAYQDQRLTVYEVVRPASMQPYLILEDGWEPFDTTRHQRVFEGQAQVTVQAPAAGRAVLHVGLAPGSASIAGTGAGTDYELSLELNPGPNQVTLSAQVPGARVIVTRLAVEPGTS